MIEGSNSGAPPSPSLSFETLFAGSPNPYVVLDPSLTLVWVNDAYCAVTGRSAEALLGRKMFDAFPSDAGSESRRLLSTSFERVFRTGERDDLALIRYDITSPDGSLSERYWSATHTPLHGADGTVAYILQHTVDVTELHGLRQMRDEMGIVERAQAVQRRNLDLTEETARLRTLFEQAPGFVTILSGPEHRFVLANAAYRRLVGGRELIGKPLREALPEVVGQGFADLLDTVRGSGKAYIGSRMKVFLDNSGSDAAAEPLFLNFVYQPIIEPGGEVSGIFVQGYDVTQEVQAEDRQKLLINELNHRVKNTLSIVQGLAAQSFRQVAEARTAQQTFEQRLNGLAAAHSLLTERDWDDAELGEIVRRSVDAAAGSEGRRVSMSGPVVALSPQPAVSLAMVIHELTTNAIKYGALSVPEGAVEVTWTLAEGDGNSQRLLLEWSERAGPPVQPPARRGFGTRLIERGLSTDLKGEAALHFEPTGLRCTIAARLPNGDE